MVVAAVVVLGGVVFAYYANYVLDRATSTDRVRSDKNAEKAIDREQPAFVSTITPPATTSRTCRRPSTCCWTGH
ncbi:hypothetical protein [Streptomyces canus]|uniref:hypothetical protein n=1 Tax=Streptomyces canus TaxID=58343 RepID=UPI003CF5107F